MPKYPGISPYDNEKGTLGTAKKRWEKLYVKEIESDTVSGMEAQIDYLATTAENSVANAVAAKNEAEQAKTAAQTAAETAATAAAGIQSVVETDVDNTLSIAGVAADAKVTGDWLRDIAKPVTLDTSLPATAYADEYMKVTTDSEGRVLYGVKRDGTFTWQKGVPKHVQDKINELAAPTIDNDEYMYVMLDSEGRVLFGVKRDGSFDWQKGIPQHVIEACNPTMVSNEYLYLIKDLDNRVIFAIKRDGSVDWQKGVPSSIRRYIDDHIAYINSPLAGKRWAVFGDSITARTAFPWVKLYYEYIADNTGVVTLDYGVGGSGYKKGDDAGTAFYQRVQSLNPDDFDVLTIFGSGNDANAHLPFGSITDTTADTIFGCVNLTIEAYLDIAINKPIGIVTPCPWGYWPTTDSGNWMDEYSNGLLAIAKRYGIPCMDLYHGSGMFPWVEEFKQTYFIGDTIHPNSLGHEIYLAPKFREFILKLL